MQTREQRFAHRTMECIDRIKGNEKQPKTFKTVYGALCHKLPVLILTAGLAQALAFVESRAPKAPKDKREGAPLSPHHQLLLDLAFVLTSVGEPAPQDASQLLRQAQAASLTDYMRLTRLTLAALVWFKRYAQSVLQVEASDADLSTADLSLEHAGGRHAE